MFDYLDPKDRLDRSPVCRNSRDAHELSGSSWPFGPITAWIALAPITVMIEASHHGLCCTKTKPQC